jgi:hypothetical protein
VQCDNGVDSCVQGDTGLAVVCNVKMVLGVVCKVTLGWELCAM